MLWYIHLQQKLNLWFKFEKLNNMIDHFVLLFKQLYYVSEIANNNDDWNKTYS